MLAAQKSARRTSSPVLPPPGGTQSMFPLKSSQSAPTASPTSPSGAVFELESIPTIPSILSSSQFSPVPWTASQSSSLPSLAATNTASSGLSAIPEISAVSVKSGDEGNGIPESTAEMVETVPKEEDGRRLWRSGKHATPAPAPSTPPTSASIPHANSLKLHSPPSIAQVLDRAGKPNPDTLVQ